MNAKLKIFKNLEPKEEAEKQISDFLDKNVKEIIDIKIYETKISKVEGMFEVEVNGYSCNLLYIPV